MLFRSVLNPKGRLAHLADQELVTKNFPRVAKFLNGVGEFLGMAPPPSATNAPPKPAEPYKDPRILGNPGTIAEQVAAMSPATNKINAAAGADTAPDKKLSTVLDALGELNKKIFDANNAIRVLEPELAKALKAGDSVALAGFGAFVAKVRPARTGRNPKTGEAIAIAESRVPAFKSGKALKDLLN